ncbi:MAG: hypothetical protein JWM82_4271 [Myxococcales bacterium]|jgi:hypothetical protein|nr:hypothetical protein [Myxococcales bacterium]
MAAKRPRPFDPEKLAARVEREMARLGPRLPDIDPDDLALILQSVLRPAGSGRRFILRRAGIGFVL